MLKHTGVEANRLLDAVINILKLKNDAALSRAIGVAPPVVSRIRHGKLTVGHMMIARIHEATGLPVSDLRMLIENDGTANKNTIIGSYRANVERDKEQTFNYDIPSTNVNYFLDALLKLCHIKNDAALCKMIDVSAPVLSKIRSAKIPIGTSMLIRFHELGVFKQKA